MICSTDIFPADVFDSQRCVGFNGQADEDQGSHWGQAVV